MLFISSPLFGGSTVEEMETRHQKNVSTPQGKSFGKEAVYAFWGDYHFLRECAPLAGSVSEYVVYFEILPDGALGEIFITPDTPAAQCVKEKTANRVYSKPPEKFVAKIVLKFKP
ncbi:MAG: hypothetical protein EHM45_02670 [Desulfobacteraceae bacterium]|nr:MAG: hypothetical protein EHM45_02670 [Desulfobacteraceae bacterium]